ncbi:hypothetical protein CROQUDRAFT_98233 [Cronartium quercuum f. sp. fusiforme G11]|uniref:Uncharacterized protein n=1 Tax=Cronartium quercuum f. sp. fusiforme G11 TaxID=708437 RepID=A0A9P6NA79_9BASI|nr:hypothetical protein CROQUDRAFT_98233 [Cronartium quercuum f. sp. fusiforme G11]
MADAVTGSADPVSEKMRGQLTLAHQPLRCQRDLVAAGVDVTFSGPRALTCTRTSTLTYTAVLLFCPFCKRPCTPRRISASSLLAISSTPCEPECQKYAKLYANVLNAS